MDEALAAADLVICRAGAATIAEITVRGLPTVLIPYPYASDNHQEHNARALAKNGAALMILDRDLTGETLWDMVRELYQDPPGLAAMGHALLHLVDIVDALAL